MNDLVLQYSAISDRWKKEIIKARKRGMNKAVTKIKNKAKSLYKSSFPSSKTKYSDSLADAARVSKYKESDLAGEAIAGVHIMGLRKSGSGTFRTKFFENGTIDRHTRKGYNRGRIKSRNLFGMAVNERLRDAPTIIEQELIKTILKLND